MRFLVALLVALPLVAALLGPAVPAEAATCQFSGGFKTLHDLIPNVVGDCIENVHYDAISGDGLQQTTRGLLVWRKADNWTAFTDGYHTWINGPNGLQERLNTERFAWELDLHCTLPAGDVSVSWKPSSNGSAVGQGTVANPCSDPLLVMVDAEAVGSNGQPLEDAPTVFKEVPADASVPLTVVVPSAGNAPGFDRQVAGYDADAPGYPCVPVDPTDCLTVDPRLITTVGALDRLDEGHWLLAVAAQHDVRVAFYSLPSGVEGFYLPSVKAIVLDPSLLSTSSWARAAILAHELQHAADDAAGKLDLTTPAGCFNNENVAFQRTAQVWTDLWRGNLPPDEDAPHKELNLITRAITQNPTAFTRALVQTYQEECQGPPVITPT